MHLATDRLSRLHRSLELALNQEWPQLSATQKKLTGRIPKRIVARAGSHSRCRSLQRWPPTTAKIPTTHPDCRVKTQGTPHPANADASPPHRLNITATVRGIFSVRDYDKHSCPARPLQIDFGRIRSRSAALTQLDSSMDNQVSFVKIWVEIYLDCGH